VYTDRKRVDRQNVSKLIVPLASGSTYGVADVGTGADIVTAENSTYEEDARRNVVHCRTLRAIEGSGAEGSHSILYTHMPLYFGRRVASFFGPCEEMRLPFHKRGGFEAQAPYNN
jgi:hypothetical protein